MNELDETVIKKVDVYQIVAGLEDDVALMGKELNEFQNMEVFNEEQFIRQYKHYLLKQKECFILQQMLLGYE